jgi:hypothetical protein
VITTIDTIKRRPDLAALRLTGPSRAYVHAPVSFSAVVAELNGDVGAHADCVLSVDGQQVDQSLGIWVDAGHTVACAFQTTFATTGTKKVMVSVTNVVPGDWDLSNNTAQTTIEIVEPVVQIGYAVRADSYNGTYSYYDRFSGPWSGYSDNYQSTFTGSDAYIIGRTTKHRFQFPIQQLSGTITADGATLLQPTFASFSPPHDDGWYTCSATYSAEAYGSVCSLDDRGYGMSSQAYFVSWHEVVTYYSQHAGYQCISFGCTKGYWYVYNNSASGSSSYGTGAGTFDIGSTDQFTLNLTDASGTTYRAATPPLSVQSSSYGPSTWGYCENYWWASETYCYGNTWSETRKYVSAETPLGDF